MNETAQDYMQRLREHYLITTCGQKFAPVVDTGMTAGYLSLNYLKSHGRDFEGNHVRFCNGRDLDYVIPDGTPPIEWIKL